MRLWTESFGRRARTRALGGGLVCCGREGGDSVWHSEADENWGCPIGTDVPAGTAISGHKILSPPTYLDSHRCPDQVSVGKSCNVWAMMRDFVCHLHPSASPVPDNSTSDQ